MDRVLTNEQQDALREVVIIGAGSAATSLSKMVRKRIDITIPQVKIIRIEDAAHVLGGAEVLTVAVTLKLLGDATGVMLFLFKKADALRISDSILGEPAGKSKSLSDMAQSALKETASILAGSYLSAMSKLLKMKFTMSSPSLTQDMAGAIIDDAIIETGMSADDVLIVDTELSILDEKAMAYYFFMPESDSLKKILANIGVG